MNAEEKDVVEKVEHLLIFPLLTAGLIAVATWTYTVGNRVVALEVQQQSIQQHLALIRGDIARVEQKVDRLGERK